mgnify:CR=1 FL=1|tara:strand:+ start:50 stop:2653 length:2604 start_codon:yes stop_codon:yes gene_type:complete
MKRLLAYLFIVLGLGLTISVSANALNYCVDKNIEEKLNNFSTPYSSLSYYNKWFKVGVWNGINGCPNNLNLKSVSSKDYDRYLEFYNKKKNGEIPLDTVLGSTQIAKAEPSQNRINYLCDDIFNTLNSTPTQNNYCKNLDHTTSRFYNIYKNKIDRYDFCLFPLNNQANAHTFPVNKNDKCVLYNLKNGKKISFNMYVRITEAIELNKSNHTFATFEKFLKQNIQDTKTAKKEPTQNKDSSMKSYCVSEMISNINKINNKAKNVPYVFINNNYDRFFTIKYTNSKCKVSDTYRGKLVALDKNKYFELLEFYKKVEDLIRANPSSYVAVGKLFQAELDKKSNLKLYKNETQITKAEPSQKQKKSTKEVTWQSFVKLVSYTGLHTTLPFFSHKKTAKIKYKSKDQYNLFTEVTNEAMNKCKRHQSTSGWSRNYKCLVSVIKYFEAEDPSKHQKLINTNGINIENIKVSWNGIDHKNVSIVQKEPTITPKKKVKVAKVEEPKQEEFKPENKEIDNDAPVIEIAEAITVDSQAYTLKGKVKDKSKLYIEANGRPLKLNKETFQIEGFIVDPEAGEQIKLVAIDQWKNKSEKTINIKVKFQEVADKRIYEIPNPSKIKVKLDRNKIAIIIGIEKYRSLKNIDAPFANRDANAFRAYANKALGIPNKNIKVLIDDNATRAETLKALTLWLPQTARGKGKDIYVFFAGHGLASDDGKNLYILPQDGDAALLQYTAISRLEIFELINKIEPSSVTMFFDTCYSGQTRDERMLVAGLRPIRLLESEQEKPTNFTIFTASNYDETSGSIEEAKHGIFSYFLMKGMEGKADENNDKKITNGELITYLKQNVSEEAFMNNRQQEPMLSGDPNKILIKFN